MIVDATRRGKRYPDSLSKTVPIWCCVLNRALEEIRREEGRESEYKAGPKGEAERGSIGESKGLRKEVADWRGVSKENEGGVRGEDDENGGQSEAGESAADDSSIRSGGPASTIAEGGPCLCQQNQKDSSMGSERKNDMHQDEVSNDVTLGTLSGTGVDASQMESGSEGGRICEAEEGEDWVSLHLPLWLSPTEKAAIGSRVEGWVEMLKVSRVLDQISVDRLRPITSKGKRFYCRYFIIDSSLRKGRIRGSTS